jgi:hypothetical protein
MVFPGCAPARQGFFFVHLARFALEAVGADGPGRDHHVGVWVFSAIPCGDCVVSDIGYQSPPCELVLYEAFYKHAMLVVG